MENLPIQIKTKIHNVFLFKNEHNNQQTSNVTHL